MNELFLEFRQGLRIRQANILESNNAQIVWLILGSAVFVYYTIWSGQLEASFSAVVDVFIRGCTVIYFLTLLWGLTQHRNSVDITEYRLGFYSGFVLGVLLAGTLAANHFFFMLLTVAFMMFVFAASEVIAKRHQLSTIYLFVIGCFFIGIPSIILLTQVWYITLFYSLSAAVGYFIFRPIKPPLIKHLQKTS